MRAIFTILMIIGLTQGCSKQHVDVVHKAHLRPEINTTTNALTSSLIEEQFDEAKLLEKLKKVDKSFQYDLFWADLQNKDINKDHYEWIDVLQRADQTNKFIFFPVCDGTQAKFDNNEWANSFFTYFVTVTKNVIDQNPKLQDKEVLNKINKSLSYLLTTVSSCFDSFQKTQLEEFPSSEGSRSLPALIGKLFNSIAVLKNSEKGKEIIVKSLSLISWDQNTFKSSKNHYTTVDLIPKEEKTWIELTNFILENPDLISKSNFEILRLTKILGRENNNEKLDIILTNTQVVRNLLKAYSEQAISDLRLSSKTKAILGLRNAILFQESENELSKYTFKITRTISEYLKEQDFNNANNNLKDIIEIIFSASMNREDSNEFYKWGIKENKKKNPYDILEILYNSNSDLVKKQFGDALTNFENSPSHRHIFNYLYEKKLLSLFTKNLSNVPDIYMNILKSDYGSHLDPQKMYPQLLSVITLEQYLTEKPYKINDVYNDIYLKLNENQKEEITNLLIKKGSKESFLKNIILTKEHFKLYLEQINTNDSADVLQLTNILNNLSKNDPDIFNESLTYLFETLSTESFTPYLTSQLIAVIGAAHPLISLHFDKIFSTIDNFKSYFSTIRLNTDSDIYSFFETLTTLKEKKYYIEALSEVYLAWPKFDLTFKDNKQERIKTLEKFFNIINQDILSIDPDNEETKEKHKKFYDKFLEFKMLKYIDEVPMHSWEEDVLNIYSINNLPRQINKVEDSRFYMARRIYIEYWNSKSRRSRISSNDVYELYCNYLVSEGPSYPLTIASPVACYNENNGDLTFNDTFKSSFFRVLFLNRRTTPPSGLKEFIYHL